MDAIKAGLVGTKDGIIGIKVGGWDQETLLGLRQVLMIKKGLKGEIAGLKTDIFGIRTDIADSKKELKADIDGVKKELSQVELRLRSNFQYGQGISMGSAYASMKCLGKREMKREWEGDIAKGARSDGEGCALVKAAGEAKKG